MSNDEKDVPLTVTNCRDYSVPRPRGYGVIHPNGHVQRRNDGPIRGLVFGLPLALALWPLLLLGVWAVWELVWGFLQPIL